MIRNSKSRLNSNLTFFEVLVGAIFVLVVATMALVPVTGYFKVVSLQRILNTECKGNYELIDVALNGDSLLQACRINNQSITIK